MAISIRNLVATPNDCPLLDTLHLSFEFETLQAVDQALWEFTYHVDVIYKNLSLILGATAITSYQPGKHCVEIDINLDSILKGMR